MDSAVPPILPVRWNRQSFLLGLSLFAVVAMSAAAVLFCFDPAQFAFYPFCWFHRTTGLLCPGCGALRGLHQLLHGHIAAAFRLNPLLVLGLPIAALFAGRGVLRRL